MKSLVLSLVVCGVVLAQGTTSRLDGTVTDPQGAAVADAQIQVHDVRTGQIFKATTDTRGLWVIPSMPSAIYSVTVTHPGFRATTVENVTVNAGVPATVNARLELGQVTETVEVNAGAEIIQATSASVSSTLTGRQVFELPFASRNAVELLVTQPGTMTPTNPRSSTINGLPKGALNVTMDGMNTQDNLLKSSDGFFSYIMPSADAVDELTLTTSAGGVDSTSQGAAQIKFVTRSGTNQFHGGAFWQVRNTIFNANYYFNNQNGLPRDIVKLNQGGFHAGGPIKKDKLFFFTNYEIYRLPGTKSYTRQILTDTARQGIFTYQDATTKQLRTVNLYQLAAAANATLPASVRPYPITPDPIMAQTLSQIAALSANGTVRSRVPTNNDYNRNDLNYQPTGSDSRDFLTTRLDYNITSKHQLSFIYNYNKYDSVPDFLNNVVAAFPGTGTVLGTDVNTGQRSNRFSGSLGLRSVLTPRLTNEWRGGLNSGTVLFFDAIGSSALFSQWKGYQPFLGNTTSTTTPWISNVTTTTNSSRRNSPVKEFSDTLNWIKGSHQLSFGGNFDTVNLFNQSVSSSVMPRVGLGIAAGDPVVTGNNWIFNNTNFLGASSTALTDAENLYAVLTGRVSSITRQLALDEKSHTYGPNSAIDRDRIREYGLYVQDTWRVFPTLTLSAGIRYERQLPFVNISNVYTRVGIAGVWGLSGVGNLFQPGKLPGVVPAYQPADSVPNAYSIPAVWAPSIGAAWQLPHYDGPLGWLLGRHEGASVLRLGYSIATIREGSNIFTSIWGSNQGLLVDASLAPTTFPADFGPAGSVLLRDPTFPSRSGLPSAPVYPIPASFTTSVNEFDPNLKMGYVQSWNIGWQREFGSNNVVEVRYTGNHGVKEWRQYNINEVNIFENGFINDFKAAQNNLAIARQTNPNSNNFGNQGLPGQQAVPILLTALGTTNDATTANQLVLGQAGATAYAISTNSGRLANLTKAGYPANFFVANPTVAGGGAFLLTNGGSSFYDAMQVEFRRRISGGLLVQGSYAFSKALANGATSSSSDTSQPATLRNISIDKVPESFDIRHAFKVNYIYELPFGPGRRFLSGLQHSIARKALEGWEIAGVTRIQSGTPFFLNGSSTFNQISSTANYSNGVILHNMTQAQLQSMIGIYKTTGSDGKGIVYFLPQNVIHNSQAAFGQAGLTPAQVDPTQPYISPAPAGQLGYRDYFYLPWQRHWDISLVKITKIREFANVEFRVQALNVFNLTNFLPDATNQNTNSATFGQITAAYRDISGTVDPGGRMLEFVLRVNF